MTLSVVLLEIAIQVSDFALGEGLFFAIVFDWFESMTSLLKDAY